MAMERGNNAEHPRASISDDVECLFSMICDVIGRNFTVKQVKYEFRRVCMEFTKRLDPDLPYYYHISSTHDIQKALCQLNQAKIRSKLGYLNGNSQQLFL